MEAWQQVLFLRRCQAPSIRLRSKIKITKRPTKNPFCTHICLSICQLLRRSLVLVVFLRELSHSLSILTHLSYSNLRLVNRERYIDRHGQHARTATRAVDQTRECVGAWRDRKQIPWFLVTFY